MTGRRHRAVSDSEPLCTWRCEKHLGHEWNNEMKNEIFHNFHFLISRFWWKFPQILQTVHTFPQILTLSAKKSKNSAKFSSKSSRKNFIYHSANEISFFILQNFDAAFLLKNCDWSGAKECESCRSRKILKNAPTLAIVAVDTAENEPLKIWGWFHSWFNQLPSGACRSGPAASRERKRI